MIDFSQLNRVINEYLRNPCDKSFYWLELQMRAYGFPKWKIEKLIDSAISLPNAHLASIYLWVDRPLEGSYYLRKHLEENDADMDVWGRHRVWLRQEEVFAHLHYALKSCCLTGQIIGLFERLIHALARGDIGTAIHNTKALTAQRGIADCIGCI